MSLTSGRGPLSPEPAGWFVPTIGRGTVFVEPHPRRIRAIRAGEVVLDTERAVLVHRAGSPVRYAFPASLAEDLPSTPEPTVPGFVLIPWEAVDEWHEEGRRLVHHPPNPYHRVDARATQRHLRVELHGTVLVDTDQSVILFETSLPSRLYVESSAVRMDLLRRSATSTYCNYKGYATYWSAVIGEDTVEDVAWSYEDPLPESSRIAGHLSFDESKATVTAELPADQPQIIDTDVRFD